MTVPTTAGHPATRIKPAMVALAGLLLVATTDAPAQIPTTAKPTVIAATDKEPVAPGRFKPSWESLQQYRVPEWFRDAKFGIWAHWGAQCEPARGDWYARDMYSQGNGRYNDFVARYGHPSTKGFKDVIHQWTAANWDPDKLLALYRRAGARYFVALANHHDNFDNYNSKYQPWNSVKLGPKEDLVGGWAKAARAHGLRFGVSVHAAHAWSWYEVTQGADKTGPLAGKPYDGKLTKADGRGTWWEGFDPQDLYEQRHAPSPDFQDLGLIHKRWNWGNGVTPPDAAYCGRFFNRTMNLINQYRPDLIYFDDTGLPLWPVSDAGLKIAAHFYNSNNAWHGKENDGVLCGKILDEVQRKCLAWDIERGIANEILPDPWQTDTCIGGWHYEQAIFDRHGYKSAKTVVQTLVDVVSKNGNLLLSIPLPGDGAPDADEIAVIEGIAGWMEVNAEAIHGTRPWKVFGEGPQMASAAPLSAQGFNEGSGKPFTAGDVRFTTKGGTLYAIVMGAPMATVRIRSLGTQAKLLDKPIQQVALLGGRGDVHWQQHADALAIDLAGPPPNETALVFKITSGG